MLVVLGIIAFLLAVGCGVYFFGRCKRVLSKNDGSDPAAVQRALRRILFQLALCMLVLLALVFAAAHLLS